VEGREEWVEFQATALDRASALSRLKGLLPAGVVPEHLYQILPSSPPLSALTVQVYEARMDRLTADERGAAASRLAAFEGAAEWPITKASKGETKTYDLKARVLSTRLQDGRVEVHLKQGGFMDFVGMLFPGSEKERVSLARLRFDFPPDV